MSRREYLELTDTIAARRCVDCGAELNDGEATVFTVCDECWRKHYPLGAPPAGSQET
jgi:NMD protein affecting ribosome stability and mRNA decay